MIKIYTDSSANITPAEAENLGVTIAPLTITFGDTEYKDAFDITADEFYDKLTDCAELPRSSQVNTATFEEIFSDAEKNGDTLLVILISSALSGTYDSAITAKENIGYKNIYVFDSLCTTIMQKLLVVEAVKNRHKSPQELMTHLKELRNRLELYAVVDTLDYLHRGGRLKKSTAIVGKLLHIKPIITISQQGAVEIAGKAIGSKLAFRNLKKLADPDKIDYNYPVYYVYSKYSDKCKMLISEIHPDRPEYIDEAPNLCPVIGVHIGPGAAGLCYIRSKTE